MNRLIYCYLPLLLIVLQSCCANKKCAPCDYLNGARYSYYDSLGSMVPLPDSTIITPYDKTTNQAIPEETRIFTTGYGPFFTIPLDKAKYWIIENDSLGIRDILDLQEYQIDIGSGCCACNRYFDIQYRLNGITTTLEGPVDLIWIYRELK